MLSRVWVDFPSRMRPTRAEQSMDPPDDCEFLFLLSFLCVGRPGRRFTGPRDLSDCESLVAKNCEMSSWRTETPVVCSWPVLRSMGFERLS
jgi:hypothetical protein